MKRIRILLLLITILLGISYQVALCEDDYLRLPDNIGFYGGLNLNMYSPSFRLPVTGLSNPINFDKNSTSTGFHLGLITNFPLSDYFTISGRFGYNGLSGAIEKETNYGTPDTNSNFTLDANYHLLEFSPIVQFHNIIPLRNLYFLAGLELGVPISETYSLSEKIINPAGGTPTIPSIADEEIPDKAIRIAGAIGVGYTFLLSNSVFLSPEVSYRLPFTKVSDNANFDSWNIPQLRVGISLTFGFTPVVEKPVEIRHELDVGFSDVRYYDNEGKHYPLKSIRVEEVQYAELFPYIPYVFFDESSNYPSSNTQILASGARTGEFSILNVNPDAVIINEHTLDIVGRRMQDITNAELTVTGCTDSKKEAGNSDLAKKRAEFAKDYITNSYKINPERINIKIGGTPEKPSTSAVPEGVEENRRIEFASSNKKLLEPILLKKDDQSLADPNLIEFVPYAVSSDSITLWNMEISQSGNILRNFTGKGVPIPLQWVIIPNELKSSQLPVEYTFRAENSAGLSKSATGTIPVDYYSVLRKKTEEMPDKTISKYSLILFDFDKADITEKDMDVINEHIIPDIKFNSTIKVYGYTDIIGNEDYNRKLAERRANAVKDLLQSAVKTAKIETYGVGENDIIFDNGTPVGRQLSRTVQIYVITPR